MSRTMTILLLVMISTILIASAWNSILIFKQTAHAVLDPTAGKLLDYNRQIGMIVIALVISFILSLIQKLTIDPEELEFMKEKQRKTREELKLHKDNPQKLSEIQKKQMAGMGEDMRKNFEMSGKSIIYTAIPIVLFFRWFNDYFSAPQLAGFKFFGIFSWFWYYLILVIISGLIFKKILKM